METIGRVQCREQFLLHGPQLQIFATELGWTLNLINYKTLNPEP